MNSKGTDRTIPRFISGDVALEQNKSVVTVVGIGSEFRGDDAVGITVLRQLKGNLPAGARAVELTGDQSYLLELMRLTDAMILVDAVQSSAPAGTVFRLDAGKEPLPKDFLLFSTHAFNSASAIKLARGLGSLPGTILIYGIVGKNFNFGLDLTPEVEEVVEIICSKIISDINHIMTRKENRKVRFKTNK